MSVICTKCGAVLPDDSKFCGICGNKITIKKDVAERIATISAATMPNPIENKASKATADNITITSQAGASSTPAQPNFNANKTEAIFSNPNQLAVDNEIVTEKTEIIHTEQATIGNVSKSDYPAMTNKSQRTEVTDPLNHRVKTQNDVHHPYSRPIKNANNVGTKFSLKAVIIIAVVAIICAAAIIAVLVLLQSDANTKVDNYLTTAAKYLVEMNYEQAIIEFDKILEIDPMNVEAYLGKAKAYHAMGKDDKAILTLKDGYEKTGDERLWKLLTEYDTELLIFPAEPSYVENKVAFSRVSEVGGGYIAASNDDGLWYLIDTLGNKLCNTGFKSISPFVGNESKSYSLVTLSDDRFVLIDNNFKEILDLSDKNYVRLFNNEDPLIMCWHLGKYDDDADNSLVEIIKPDGTQVYQWKENEGVSGSGISILDDTKTPDSIKNYKCDTKYHENLWLTEISSNIYDGVYYNSNLDRIFITYNVSANYDYDHAAEEAAWAAEDEEKRQQAIANGGGIWSTAHNTHGHYTYQVQTYEIQFKNGTITLKESPRIAVSENNSVIDFGIPAPVAGIRLVLTKNVSQISYTSLGWNNSTVGDLYEMYGESLFKCSKKKANKDDPEKYALFKPKWYNNSDEAGEKYDSEWEQLTEWYDYISDLDKDTGTFLVGIDDRWGYIDQTGKEIAMFDDASNFSGGYAVVTEKGKGRVVNSAFEQIDDDFDCESCHVIGEGIFAVKNGDSYSILVVNS